MDLSRSNARFALPAVVAVLLSVVVVGAFVGIAWLFGGVRTSGTYLDWDAIGAIATLVASLAALGALATLSFSVAQFSATQRDERASRLPYLRVDVGFDNESVRHGGFSPPPTEFVFTPQDFGIDDELEGLRRLVPAFGQRGHGLVLWVTNQQIAPLGTAFDIQIELVVSWLESGVPENSVVRVRFTYVEPSQTTALMLAHVRASVSELVVRVISVSYSSFQNHQRLSDRHGATLMYYDGATKDVRNERTYGFGEER